MSDPSSSHSERAFYFFLAQATNAFISFLFAPILVRSLPSADFGVYGQAVLSGEIAAVFFGTALYQVANSFYARFPGEEPRVYHTLKKACILSGAVGSVLMFLLGLLIWYVSADRRLLGISIMAYAPSTFFFTIGSASSSTLMYLKNSKTISYVVLLSNLIRIIVIFTLLRCGFSIYAVLLFTCFLRFLEWYLLTRAIPAACRIRTEPDKKMLRDIYHQVWRLSISNVLGISHLIVSGILITLLLSDQQYAYYRGGAIDIFLVGYLAIAINAVLGPTINQLVVRDEYEEAFRLKKKGVSQVVVLAFPFICWFLLIATPFFRLYLTDEYVSSGVVFSLFNLPLLIKTIDYTDMLIAKRETVFMLRAYLLFFILCILLNYFFIRQWGIAGAALANAIGFYLLYISFIWRVKIIYKRKVSELLDIRKLLLTLALSILAGLCCRSIYHYTQSYLWLLVASALILPAIYLLLVRWKWIDLQLYAAIAGKNAMLRKIFDLLVRWQKLA